MKTAVVNSKSFMTPGYRIDPDVHLSEGVQIRRELHALPFELSTVGENAEKVFYGNIFSRIFVKKPEYGMTYLAASDTVLADLNTGRYLSKTQAKKLDYLTLKRDWILVTCSGTLGNVTYTNSNFENHIATHDLIRVIPNNNKVNKGTLYAFLASKYGYNQITQSQFGGVVKHINESQTSSIEIPVLPKSLQLSVGLLIEESASLREESTACLNNAITIFENRIGRSEFSLDYQYSSISSKSIASKFTRFDAQYQIGNALLLKEKVELSTIKINSVATKILVGNRGKREYVENNGIPFLSSSDIMLANPLRGCKQIRKNSNNIENMLVSKGDILISRSGTIGNTVIVGDTLDRVAVSEHAMKLGVDSSKIAPEYVFAYFKTKQGQHSLQILPYGSVIITLGEEFLGDVDLPIIPKEDMDNVVDLIKEYVSKNDKAIELENQAISMVEQEIEKWNK